MTQEEKKNALKKAINEGYSLRALDPVGTGKRAKQLKEGKNVSENALDYMYENLLAMLNKGEKRTTRLLSKLGKEQQEHNRKNEKDLKIKDLEAKIRLLESELESIKAGKEKAENKKGRHVLGFQLVPKEIKVKSKVYVKWYAVKNISGKVHWVYVGKDTELAEAKIRAYWEDHPELAKRIVEQN